MTAAVNYSAAATPAEHSGFFLGQKLGKKVMISADFCHKILYIHINKKFAADKKSFKFSIVYFVYIEARRKF